jgi:RNA polymerase sigma-70 factor (ECF subfamily)
MESAAVLSAYELRHRKSFGEMIIGRIKTFFLYLVSTLKSSLVESASDESIVAERVLAEKIMDDYGDTILRVAYSYLHNMSDSEDILQETLIQVIKTKPQFESESHKKAWLIRVASNLSKNKIDYNKLRDTDELNEELVANDREDLAFVWDAVKQLPERFREVIHLFYQEGYSTRDISEIIGRNESTVRSDLKRGRDQLKMILKEAYDFE